MITLLLLSLCLQQEPEWEYKQGLKSFVSRNRDQKTPEELYALGESHFNKHEHEAAARIFQAIAEQLPSEFSALREKALFSVARTLHEAGDYAAAHRTFETFLARVPDSDLAGGVYGARYYLFMSAYLLAVKGAPEKVLGVSVGSSSKSGLDLLRAALNRFTREPFTDNFYLALGQFLLDKGRLDEAETEFKLILTPGQYDKTDSAPRAQLLLASIYLKRFDGLDYDVRTLADAKREYEKFLSSYRRVKGDARQLAELALDDELLQKMLDEASGGIAWINEKLAEREWNLSEWYLWKGKPNAARIYLKSIQGNFPDTQWAKKAADKLVELEKK
jgi:outer membrane protein assembly factor BamD (BamD/ComL family)